MCDHDHDHHHHHSPEEELVEDALTLSRRWRLGEDGPLTFEALADRVAGGLDAVAAWLAEDGLLLGHVKGLLEWGGRRMAFSVTRPGQVDRRELAGGAGESALTVNVISLGSRRMTPEELADRLALPIPRYD